MMLCASLCNSQPIIHISSLDEMMPSMLQGFDGLLDAFDSDFNFDNGDSAGRQKEASSDPNSFFFDAPEDQYLPVHFQISSPRFIQLPSLGGLLSGLNHVATPQLPKPISSPMRMLSNLDFTRASMPGFSMSLVSLEHRDGKTIRTETTYGPDGSEQSTTRTVIEDQEQNPVNDVQLGDLMQALGLNLMGGNDAEEAPVGLEQLFDLDGDQGSGSPCEMMGNDGNSNPQRLSGQVSDDGEIQVMALGDLSVEDLQVRADVTVC
jgi:hypothetical protein